MTPSNIRIRRLGTVTLAVCLLWGWTAPPSQSDPVLINGAAYIKRLSMDLRGHLPTAGESKTPDELIPALLDEYMASEAFYERMLWLANDVFHTRTQDIEYFTDSFEYESEGVRNAVRKAVGEEIPRLFAYIVCNDRPLTELVTADYTVANATLGWMWNISYPGDANGSAWLGGRYLDGREHAGVLSQTSFYYRYPNTLTNKNRHRANTITRIFLGDDHFQRNVGMDARRDDNDANLDLDNATLTNPGCVACHSSMDGISAHLFGFSFGPEGSSSYARETFRTFSRQGVERSFAEVGRGLAYYGYPSRGLADLGHYIAEDPRFAQTMVRHFARFLLARNLDYRDQELVLNLAETLRSSGFSGRELIRAIVTHPQYRTVGVVGARKDSGFKAPAQTPPNTAQLDYWKAQLDRVHSAKLNNASRTEWERVARLHTIQAGYSLYRSDSRARTTAGKTIEPPDEASLAQPFKLATPEQLHTLGEALVGEIWDGYEAAIWYPPDFPHLLYNTAVKVPAGGYDGEAILDRNWNIPTTYMLVLETWGEVLAQDMVEREVFEGRPWSSRTVFTEITGTEDPYQAEGAVRRQLTEWFARFYGENIEPDSPEIEDVFGVLLLAREEARREFGDWSSVPVAWIHVLGMLMADPRLAVY